MLGISHRSVGIASFILALAAATSAAWSNASGTYVDRDANAVAMLQLVQTSDGHVTGQLTVVEIDASGKLVDGNASVTGVIDGQVITLQIRPIFLLATATNYSGRVDSTHIELNGPVDAGTLSRLVLKRGEIFDFQAGSEELKSRSREIIQARAAHERMAKAETALHKFIEHIDKLISQMESFRKSVAANINLYSESQARYRTITAKMQAYLDRERNLAGDPKVAVARSQIAVSISQGEVAMDQAHVKFQAFNMPLLQDNRLIRTQLEESERECRGARNPTPSESVSTEQTPVNATCLRLIEAAKLYKESVKQIGTAHDQTEAAYSTEHQRQSAILSDANRLSP
jgi:hypothetical protein